MQDGGDDDYGNEQWDAYCGTQQTFASDRDDYDWGTSVNGIPYDVTASQSQSGAGRTTIPAQRGAGASLYVDLHRTLAQLDPPMALPVWMLKTMKERRQHIIETYGSAAFDCRKSPGYAQREAYIEWLARELDTRMALLEPSRVILTDYQRRDPQCLHTRVRTYTAFALLSRASLEPVYSPSLHGIPARADCSDVAAVRTAVLQAALNAPGERVATLVLPWYMLTLPQAVHNMQHALQSAALRESGVRLQTLHVLLLLRPARTTDLTPTTRFGHNDALELACYRATVYALGVLELALLRDGICVAVELRAAVMYGPAASWCNAGPDIGQYAIARLAARERIAYRRYVARQPGSVRRGRGVKRAAVALTVPTASVADAIAYVTRCGATPPPLRVNLGAHTLDLDNACAACTVATDSDPDRGFAWVLELDVSRCADLYLGSVRPPPPPDDTQETRPVAVRVRMQDTPVSENSADAVARALVTVRLAAHANLATAWTIALPDSRPTSIAATHVHRMLTQLLREDPRCVSVTIRCPASNTVLHTVCLCWRAYAAQAHPVVDVLMCE